MRMVAIISAGRTAIVRSPHHASGREQGSDTSSRTRPETPGSSTANVNGPKLFPWQ
ncbi:hypothetical protein GCM10009734_19560 [Nonomuraea bangladeshensis]